MPYVSLVDRASQSRIVTYEVDEGRGGPTPQVETLADCLERGYAGPTAPVVRTPAWVWHQTPEDWATGRALTDPGSLAVVENHWAMDRDAD